MSWHFCHSSSAASYLSLISRPVGDLSSRKVIVSVLDGLDNNGVGDVGVGWNPGERDLRASSNNLKVRAKAGVLELDVGGSDGADIEEGIVDNHVHILHQELVHEVLVHQNPGRLFRLGRQHETAGKGAHQEQRQGHLLIPKHLQNRKG